MTGVERPSYPVVFPYGEHDVGVRVLSSAHDLGQQLIADSEVGFSGDVGEDPWVSGGVKGSACPDGVRTASPGRVPTSAPPERSLQRAGCCRSRSRRASRGMPGRASRRAALLREWHGRLR